MYFHEILRKSNYFFNIVGFSCLKNTLKKYSPLNIQGWLLKTILGNNMRLFNICLLPWNQFCLHQKCWRNLSCKPWIADYQWSFQGKASKHPHSFMPLVFLAWMCKLAKIEKSISCCSVFKRGDELRDLILKICT